jgi:hypothetical protein
MPAPRTYRVACDCGQLLYLGTSPHAGEAAENRHIHQALGGYSPPPHHAPTDWDRVLTVFLLGWLLDR